MQLGEISFRIFKEIINHIIIENLFLLQNLSHRDCLASFSYVMFSYDKTNEDDDYLDFIGFYFLMN